MKGRARSVYFKVEPSEDIRVLHQGLLNLSDEWARTGTESVSVFRLIHCDYLCVKAREWATPIDGANPEYKGDPEDALRQAKGLKLKWLQGRPRPEESYEGKWREFSSPEALREYAQQCIDNMSETLAGQVIEQARSDNETLREMAAASEHISDEAARALIDAGGVYELAILGKNERLPEAIMHVLADHPEWEVREALASNPAAIGEVLDSLSRSPISHVRLAVAKNESTSPETLARLAKDIEESVRLSVSENNSTPSSVLATLGRDLEPAVRQGAIEKLGERNAVLEQMTGYNAGL